MSRKNKPGSKHLMTRRTWLRRNIMRANLRVGHTIMRLEQCADVEEASLLLKKAFGLLKAANMILKCKPTVEAKAKAARPFVEKETDERYTINYETYVAKYRQAVAERAAARLAEEMTARWAARLTAENKTEETK